LIVATLARLGDAAKALEFLRAAVRRREPFLVWCWRDERYGPLRDLPEFQALIGELQLGSS
jgi:hypothetical protein